MSNLDDFEIVRVVSCENGFGFHPHSDLAAGFEKFGIGEEPASNGVR